MTDTAKSLKPLWTPKNAGRTSMDAYRHHVNNRFYLKLKSSKQLHRWSVEHPQEYWMDLYSYLKLQPSLPTWMKRAYDPTVPMSSNPPFFEGLQMNYGENAMFSNTNPDAIALIGLREDTDLQNSDGETLTWRQFREYVRRASSALRRLGIKQGDRVAALVATSIWAMILFHASACIGAIFTSISPELGLEGCVSRLLQVTPSILFADSDTIYKGKMLSIISKVEKILQKLSPNTKVFVVPISSDRRWESRYASIDKFLGHAHPSDQLSFTKVPFNYPLLICYSSGTTGAPKCIVHQHGLIIQLKKISVVHNGTTTNDVILQYSSTSWVVFYIMCGYFACGAKTIVYNGSPMFPDVTQLLRIAEKYRVTYFGTSPRYLLELEMSKVVPKDLDLSSLRIVYTTGATLSAEQYKWFYRTFPPEVHLCNTAGGTDTATSLIAADPSGAIYAGEMQIFSLGMDVDVAHPETGQSILHTGEAGEMVVRKPFPSMPCFFWGDEGNKKYKEAYFERFEGIMDVWAQHDWLSCNPRTGGLILHGRSDGVLNPSGIRFGSGEIYAIVEAAPFNSQISNSLCVGRRRSQDKDEDVFLFLVMSPGETLTPDLTAQLKRAIRQGLSPRHVPRFILQVPEIPITINGKKVEIAVKRILSGSDVKPTASVANPASFDFFKRFRDLESEHRDAKL